MFVVGEVVGFFVVNGKNNSFFRQEFDREEDEKMATIRGLSYSLVGLVLWRLFENERFP